jgi:hypothetical protein
MSEHDAGGRALPQTGAAYEAARLRWATLQDADRLVRLYAEARPRDLEARESMLGRLEDGGALVLEDAAGTPLCALR